MTFPKKIGCVGCGTIGSSWALLFARKGYQTVAYDNRPDAMENSRVLLNINLASLVKNKVVKASMASSISSRIQITETLDDVSGCDYIQESIVEDFDAKIELFRRLERVLGERAVIASSTSGLPLTAMQRTMLHPERSVIAHPFNPPHLMPLVEIVRGEKTSRGTVEEVYRLMESLGKIPVRVNKQLPGFAANRLQAAVLRESLAMIDDGVIDAEGLEKIMSAGLGLRWAFMGPLVTAQLGGGSGGVEYYLTQFGPLMETMWKSLSPWRAIPQRARMKAIRQTGELELIRGKSYAELVEWRDRNLLGILRERGYLPNA